MKVLMSVLALAVALAWPAVGEAQSNKAKARSAPSAQSHQVQRRAKVQRVPAEKPCAARTWVGCLGWDPDPNVRMMIQMDAGRDDL